MRALAVIGTLVLLLGGACVLPFDDYPEGDVCAKGPDPSAPDPVLRGCDAGAPDPAGAGAADE